jgi:hypothetical protein
MTQDFTFENVLWGSEKMHFSQNPYMMTEMILKLIVKRLFAGIFSFPFIDTYDSTGRCSKDELIATLQLRYIIPTKVHA